ncbi:small heat shock protein [Suillus ampliporus]|nr:small heat shock protein [Suillus ampliporus]
MSLSLMFYDPYAEFDKLFDDAFDARLRPSPTTEGNNTLTHRRNQAFPRMDLHENAETKTVTATFELPGLKQENINVQVQGNRLTISGESKRAENYDKAAMPTLQIPQGIKAEDVHAKLEDGVLTVSFPKAGPEQQLQRVEIA